MPNVENLRPAPFERGNKVGERHGFYSQVLNPVDNDELAEIADVLRELTPLDADALEPLVSLVAGQLWRRRRAYADLDANGVVRARGKPAPILRDLSTLERSILEGLKALALTPQAAASLNLTLVQTRTRDSFDPSRLTRTSGRSLFGFLTRHGLHERSNPPGGSGFSRAQLAQVRDRAQRR